MKRVKSYVKGGRADPCHRRHHTWENSQGPDSFNQECLREQVRDMGSIVCGCCLCVDTNQAHSLSAATWLSAAHSGEHLVIGETQETPLQVVQTAAHRSCVPRRAVTPPNTKSNI